MKWTMTLAMKSSLNPLSRKLTVSAGFSLIEIILSVMIVALIGIAMARVYLRQVASGRDSRRKADLQLLKTVFEDYYSDNLEYPPTSILRNCNSDDLRPYLASIPCDPVDQAYLYVPYPNATDRTDGYRIYAALERDDDPIIAELGCDGADGCGVPPAIGGADAAKYNYGVSQGIEVVY